jgi:hypothetical protein
MVTTEYSLFADAPTLVCTARAALRLCSSYRAIGRRLRLDLTGVNLLVVDLIGGR